ncbi:MAG TPA: ferrochelatase, partial [Candidatus Cybelea sp.]|nr:ferrochelatase [Candidatus Cybelea sp.]
MARIAVVLTNLGGPDSLQAVEPFLRNLFADPAIISLPAPLRQLLAWVIARRRAAAARAIYEQIGGRSPLRELTEAQASALQGRLGDIGDLRVFVAMRHWHPFARETAAEVAAFAPERVIVVPLYPQYSTTTTASSLADWDRAAMRAGLSAPRQALCCYPTAPGLIAAHVDLIRRGFAEAAEHGKPRVLFSAHGLPQKVVDGGDPYQWQVERTAAAIVAGLGLPGLDWRVCYQSRVGPLQWLQPSTEAEIHRAGADRVPIVVVPIAFVSEHSETLVELDIDYRRRANDAGVAAYVRVPALGTHPSFIAALETMVRHAIRERQPLRSAEGARLCPAACGRCA